METKNIAIRKSFRNGPAWDEKLKCFCCRLRLPADENGYRQEIKKRFRNKRDAERWFHTTEAAITRGEYDHRATQSKRLTLGAGFDLYRASVRSIKSFDSTQRHLALWEREFGRDTRLAAVTKPRIVEAVAKRLESGIKKSTSNGNLIILKCAFNYLEREGIYVSNPAKGIRLFKVDNRRRLYLKPDQFERLLKHCENGPWYLKPVIIVATLTGLRQGNVLGLEWSEIDFDDRYIRIMGSKMKNGRTLAIPMYDMVYDALLYVHQKRHERGDSKYVFPDFESSGSQRRFMPDLKINAVRNILAGETMSAVGKRHGVRLDLLCKWTKQVRERGEQSFQRPRLHVGDKVTAGAFERAWKWLRRASGIERDFYESHNDSFHFHDLRHTFGSWHAIIDTGPFRLKELMGHDNLQSTERYVCLSGLLANDLELQGTIRRLFTVTRDSTPAERKGLKMGDRKATFPKTVPIKAAKGRKRKDAPTNSDKIDIQGSLFGMDV